MDVKDVPKAHPSVMHIVVYEGTRLRKEKNCYIDNEEIVLSVGRNGIDSLDGASKVSVDVNMMFCA